MTDTRLTQTSVEHWLATSPQGQVTQVAVEHWGTVSAATLQTVVTQVAIEHWAVVPPVSAGGSQAIAMMLA